MNKLMVVLAFAATMAFASFVSAKDAAAKGPHGKVTKVEKDSADSKITNVTITSGHGDKAKETVIKLDETTPITKGDAKMTLADVTIGTSITVTQDDAGKVTGVTINPPHAKKPKN